ncbi:hypothetical protein APHAL10511_000356 [Amanita phalloides]|nr:hypothetical protein APHAL10511_000356 [Amanita phalloides]
MIDVPDSSAIAELMAVKSKHGAGGEYSPDWRPSNLKVPFPPSLLDPDLGRPPW